MLLTWTKHCVILLKAILIVNSSLRSLSPINFFLLSQCNVLVVIYRKVYHYSEMIFLKRNPFAAFISSTDEYQISDISQCLVKYVTKSSLLIFILFVSHVHLLHVQFISAKYVLQFARCVNTQILSYTSLVERKGTWIQC